MALQKKFNQYKMQNDTKSKANTSSRGKNPVALPNQKISTPPPSSKMMNTSMLQVPSQRASTMGQVPSTRGKASQDNSNTVNTNKTNKKPEEKKTSGNNWWDNLKSGVSNAWESTKAAASYVYDGIKSGDLVNDALAGVSNSWEGIKAGAAKIGNGIATGAGNVWEGIKTGNVWEGIKTGAGNAWDGVSSGAVKMVGETIDMGIQMNPLSWIPMYLNSSYRESLNTPLPETMSGASPEAGWRELPQKESIYHQKGEGNEGNRKFIHGDGREAIYDENGNPVTDHLNGGTYNFGVIEEGGFNLQTAPSYIKHGIFDVLPYYLYGDGPEDPTNIFERITGKYKE